MVKGQSFGEMFPEGECMLCKGECEKGSVMHYNCALAWVDVKTIVMEEIRKRRKESMKK